MEDYMWIGTPVDVGGYTGGGRWMSMKMPVEAGGDRRNLAGPMEAGGEAGRVDGDQWMSVSVMWLTCLWALV